MRHGITMFSTDQSLDVVRLAREVEARGFDSLYLPEHTHIPVSRRTPPPTGEDELLGVVLADQPWFTWSIDQIAGLRVSEAAKAAVESAAVRALDRNLVTAKGRATASATERLLAGVGASVLVALAAGWPWPRSSRAWRSPSPASPRTRRAGCSKPRTGPAGRTPSSPMPT